MTTYVRHPAVCHVTHCLSSRPWHPKKQPSRFSSSETWFNKPHLWTNSVFSRVVNDFDLVNDREQVDFDSWERKKQNWFWFVGLFYKCLIIFHIELLQLRKLGIFFFSTISSWKLQPPVWKPASANCGSLLWPWTCSHVSEGLDNRIWDHSDFSTITHYVLSAATATLSAERCSLLLCVVPAVLINHDAFSVYQSSILFPSWILKEKSWFCFFIHEGKWLL